MRKWRVWILLVLLMIPITGWAAQFYKTISCGTTAAVALPMNSNRLGAALTNLDATVTIYLGDAAVTTTDGYALTAGATWSQSKTDQIGDPIYCRVASGTASLSTWYFMP